jgi:hypothetical protein
MASGGEERLGQTARRHGTVGRGQRGSRKRWRWAEAARGSALSNAGAAVRGTWPAGAAAARRAEEQRREREGRRRRTGL